MEKSRKNMHLFYLSMAKQAAERSTCIRKRFGSVLVSCDDEIVAIGANYSPYPIKGCTEVGSCFRRENKIPSHTRMDVCRALTAEQCTVMKAPTKNPGSILYTYGVDNETEEPIRGFPHQVSVKFLLMAGVTAIVTVPRIGSGTMLGYEVFHVGTSNFAEDAGHIQL